MTVGELRKALDGIDDSLDITVRAERDSDGESFVGGVLCAEVQFSHDDDLPYFAIDCMDDGDYSPNATDGDPPTKGDG